MVYITGDTHGSWINRLCSYTFPEGRDMNKNDYVIMLGDFGIWDNSDHEKYALDWLDNKPFTTLFISGNHDNYDILDNLPVEEWHGGKVNYVRDSVIHLMRGQVFNIEDKSFFTFGGASSHDISDGILDMNDPDFKEKKKKLDMNPYSLYRIDHKTWWSRELPSENEMLEGVENLKIHNNKVDYILTHSPYTSILSVMDGNSGLYKSDVLSDYLQNIKQTVDYKHWLFGHMHVNENYYFDRSTCIYEQIIRII